MRILVVEDNVDLCSQIEEILQDALYVVDTAHDGRQALYLGTEEPYDAVVLDLGLPKLDGLEVLRRWRDGGVRTPVLILTSRNSWREKVVGLRAGADDYLAKPFEFEELLARIEALIRRSAGRASSVLRCADGRVVLDVSSATLTLDGATVSLTPLEFRTLEYLLRNRGQVVSKTELTEHIYDQDFDRDSNVIEVLINRLRGKLWPELIRTRRGLGYQLMNGVDER